MDWLNIQEYGFTLFIILTYVFYITSILGIIFIKPDFYQSLDLFVKLYVSLFLLWRFHPFRQKATFTNLDRKLAFHAGAFIFVAMVVQGMLRYYIDDIKKYAKDLDLLHRNKPPQPTIE